MNPMIAERYTVDMRDLAAARFGLRVTGAFEHGENHVFAAQQGDDELVLRLTHTLHREAEQIAAELHWIRALGEAGVDVAASRAAAGGEQIIRIDDGHDDGHAFLCTCFDRAPGDEPDESSPGWNAALYERWGRLVGQMHAQARTYTPGPTRRPQRRERDLGYIRQHMPRDPDWRRQSESLLARIESLPTDERHYGLIHADHAAWNCRVTPERLCVFDFDSSQYAWFIYDVAICLYYAAPLKSPPAERLCFLREFAPAFRRGYDAAAPWQPEWAGWIDDMLILQSVYMTAIIHDKHGYEPSEQRLRDLLSTFRRRLFGQERVFEIDWTELL